MVIVIFVVSNSTVCLKRKRNLCSVISWLLEISCCYGMCSLPHTSAAYDGEHPWSFGDPFCWRMKALS